MKNSGLDCILCDPRSIDDIRRIAIHNYTGGIVAIAFYVAETGVSRSSFNTSGNTDQLRADIESYYKDHEDATIFIVGHSAGGDSQNLLWKLKVLGILVNFSGHIDSIEFLSGDAIISDNTKRTMGFYQDDSPYLTRGEANLFAENPAKTTLTNTRIPQPQGQSDPISDNNAYHRNMDNDERVWGSILHYIKTHR